MDQTGLAFYMVVKDLPVFSVCHSLCLSLSLTYPLSLNHGSLHTAPLTVLSLITKTTHLPCPLFILISSFKFDNYMFSLLHEFLWFASGKSHWLGLLRDQLWLSDRVPSLVKTVKVRTAEINSPRLLKMCPRMPPAITPEDHIRCS